MAFYHITEEQALDLYADEIEAAKELLKKLNEPISPRHGDNYTQQGESL